MFATSKEMACAALLSDTVILRWPVTAEVCVRAVPGGRSLELGVRRRSSLAADRNVNLCRALMRRDFSLIPNRTPRYGRSHPRMGTAALAAPRRLGGRPGGRARVQTGRGRKTGRDEFAVWSHSRSRGDTGRRMVRKGSTVRVRQRAPQKGPACRAFVVQERASAAGASPLVGRVWAAYPK